jgi:hypothetical protein
LRTFLEIFAFLFFVAGIIGMLALQPIVGVLALGFAALMLASSAIIDHLREIVREMESWRQANDGQ